MSSSFFFPLQGKALKEIHAILTETLACFLPDRAKDISAPLYLSDGILNTFLRRRILKVANISEPNAKNERGRCCQIANTFGIEAHSVGMCLRIFVLTDQYRYDLHW